MKIDYDSTVNQNIKGQFVQREVKACFSYEMDAVLSASQELNIAQQHNFPTYEEIENFYQDVCEKCGDTRLYNDANGGEQCKCGGDYESQPQEIFEWWIVTEFLYRKLKAHGKPVLEWGNNYYWADAPQAKASSSIMLSEKSAKKWKFSRVRSIHGGKNRMQNKITKAPWYIARGNNGYHVQSAKINQDNYVCFVDREADAHLIASAPELLEALKGCRDLIASKEQIEELKNNDYAQRIVLSVIDKAISKQDVN